MTENIDESIYKPYSKRQLIIQYGISYKTFNAWIKPFLKEIGSYRGKCYTPDQVKIIYNLLGRPQ